MSRRPIIAGNWKMNKTIAEGVSFINEVKEAVAGANVDVVICAPATQLHALAEAAKGTNVKVAAQNMHFEDNGAFTGEIAVSNLVELGLEFVVIGHSERREMFNETDETCNKKVVKALANNIAPILCVGESLAQREGNETKAVVTAQTKAALAGVSAEDVVKVVVAYEPIWAIGTGKVATSDQAQETCAWVREELANIYGQDTADKVRIQYGGSVKPENVAELMSKEDIDGALVGGASLVAADYVKLVNF